ncbi:MAG TPA: 50S ribosomal protein L1 [Candidatus Limnocylindria bacterium]|jgi:large subunit ribosomal protein L1|nr:MAG: 50S ribosomal protein L1 [Chloroflexota bacterium]HYS29748.1 50S ribosomal protein L1 [Candidatus Limnocylindria bacterium]
MTQARARKYKEAAKTIEHAKQYSPDEAVKLVKGASTSKFDGSIEAHLRLGVDPRHADQMVRGSVTLPHGTGKKRRVLVFAQGDKAREAKEAGADYVGGDDLAKRIQEGWLDFDVTLATPDMMGMVGRLGKVLGPRGLMPNPKAGTVTFDIAKGVKDIQGGRIEYRVDKTGIIHTNIGKASYTEQQLRENLAALMDAVVRAKPSSAKGQFLRSVYLAPTMGPSVQIDPALASRMN